MTRPYTLALFLVISLASVAQAQSNRTFVSVTGGDAISCSVAAPCRSFAAALALTSDGGEIIVLTSGGYGPVTINKTVQITAPAGIYAGITAGSGAGILVDAPGATVKIRGLSLNGRGATEGIYVAAATAFDVSDSTIHGFGHGLLAAVQTAGTSISVNNTVFSGNGSTAARFSSTGGAIFAAIDRSRAERNGNGFLAYENARVTVSNSVASHNASVGYMVLSDNQSSPAELNVESCVAHNNAAAGIYSASGNGPAMLRVTRSMATNNGYGVLSAGTMESGGDNMFRGNTTNSFGTIIVVPHL